MIRILLNFATVGLAVIFAGNAAAGEKVKLTGASLKELIAKYHVFAGADDFGNGWLEFQYPNGTRELVLKTPTGTFTYKRMHEIKSDRFCIQYAKRYKGERCVELIEAASDQYEVFEDEELKERLTLVK